MDKYAYELGAQAALLDLGVQPVEQKTAASTPDATDLGVRAALIDLGIEPQAKTAGVPADVWARLQAMGASGLERLRGMSPTGMGALGGGVLGAGVGMAAADGPTLRGGPTGALAGAGLGALAGRFGPGAYQRLRAMLASSPAAASISAPAAGAGYGAL